MELSAAHAFARKGFRYLTSRLRSVGMALTRNSDGQMKFPHRLEIVGGKLVALDLISPGSTIISGGIGNDIAFEREMIRRKGVMVVGIDPTDSAQAYVEAQFQRSALLRTHFFHLRKALYKDDTVLIMFSSEKDFTLCFSSAQGYQREEFLCERFGFCSDLLEKYP